MDTDITEPIAAAWNQAHPTQAIPANAEDFWPICRQLVDVGLVRGAEDELSTVSVGPFAIATTKHSEPVGDFLEVLLPATVTGLAGGLSLDTAIGGLLAGACRVFISTLRRSVVFGRSRDSQIRWLTLIAVNNRNSKGEAPDVAQILADVKLDGGEQLTRADVESAIDWLAGSPLSRESRTALISISGDGHCTSLV